MTSPLVLLPNLGAEEGTRAPVARVDAHTAPLARAWAALFARPLTILGADPPLDVEDAPAFDFLPADGLVPWLSTVEARDEADARGLRYRGADPAATTHVHDKAFAARVAEEWGFVPDELRGLVVVLEPAELTDPGLLARLEAYAATLPAFVDGKMTVKPRFGTSGRGRVALVAGALPPDLLARLRPLAARGGAVLEPWLPRVTDLSAHVVVEDDGPRLLGVVESLSSGAGLWRGARVRFDDAGVVVAADPRASALVGVALTVGARAHARGYRGPCGVDAFTFAVDGRAVLRPLVEVNARYTGGLVAIGRAHQARRARGVAGAGVTHYVAQTGAVIVDGDEA